jgi:hypothetical protein
MVDPDHPQLSISQQCKLLSSLRSSFYYTSKGETEQNLDLMRRIDEQFLETPSFGVREMTRHLRNDGHLANEKRIGRLMRLMGLMPIYQKPNTSRPAKGHKTYPYLLKGLSVERPNQIWCANITYLPMPALIAMGHDVPTPIGAVKQKLTKVLRQQQPEYMPMGTNGMAEMTMMSMEIPENTIPMMTGWGPYGPIEMVTCSRS